MLNLNFILRSSSTDLLTLLLPKSFRFFFLVIAGVMMVGIVSDGGGLSGNTGPLVIMTICLLCGAYYEAWFFDRGNRKIEQRFGLIFLFKRKIISMDDVEGVQISGFTTGSEKPVATDKKKFFQKEFVKLTLITKIGKIHDIETISGRKHDKITEKASTIAEFCGAPLITDSTHGL
ncbi:MAG: hypothetical protein HKM93_20040 [Desulfobacteraceae bacterium]|nr:hypothetical protein [Desulfobacteraceae bacterium]